MKKSIYFVRVRVCVQKQCCTTLFTNEEFFFAGFLVSRECRSLVKFNVGVVQSWLYFLTVIILGLITYSFIGDIETFGKSLAKVASTKISFWGNTNGYGGGDYNGYFALPGVIQWVAGLGKNEAVGGPWTAMMIFTFTITFMGIVLSPSFSMLSYSAKHPKAFSYYQI